LKNCNSRLTSLAADTLRSGRFAPSAPRAAEANRWAARGEKSGVAAGGAWLLGAAVAGGRRRVALGGWGAWVAGGRWSLWG